MSLKELSSQQLIGITDRHPWFAPARAILCRRALESSGSDAAMSAFNASFLYFPDRAFIAAELNRRQDSDFKDASLAQTAPATAQTPEKPRIILAGMDYFSREEYESVSDDSLKNLGRIAYSDNSADATEEASGNNPAKATESEEKTHDRASGTEDLVTETLALIYAEQGYNQEAARIYRKLSLQSPEKSAYFASLIDKLKN